MKSNTLLPLTRRIKLINQQHLIDNTDVVAYCSVSCLIPLVFNWYLRGTFEVTILSFKDTFIIMFC